MQLGLNSSGFATTNTKPGNAEDPIPGKKLPGNENMQLSLATPNEHNPGKPDSTAGTVARCEVCGKNTPHANEAGINGETKFKETSGGQTGTKQEGTD